MSKHQPPLFLRILAPTLLYLPILMVSLAITTEKNLVNALMTPEVAIFVLGGIAFLISPVRMRHLLQTYRVKSFQIIGGSLGVGIAVLFLLNEIQLSDFNSMLLICVFGCATLAFGNGINAYYDYQFSVDSQQSTGDDNRLVIGSTTLQSIKIDTLIALVISLIAVFRMNQIQTQPCFTLLAWCAFSIFMMYAYTGPPFKFKYRCLGEICLALFAVSVVMIMAIMLGKRGFSLAFILYVFVIGFLGGLSNFIRNVRDFEGDKQAGIMTLPILFGEQGIKIFFISVVVLFAILPFVFAAISGIWMLLCHLTLPIGILAIMKNDSLSVDALYQEGMMLEYVHVSFLVLVCACYVQIGFNFLFSMP